MSYDITFNTRLGNTVTMSLEGGTGSLPVYGYRFQFNLSRYGFGQLNRKVTLDIADNDTFYNLLLTQKRKDLKLTITHSEIGKLFLGYPDIQLMRRVKYQDNRKAFRVVFVDSIGFLNTVRYVSTGLDFLSERIPVILFADYFKKMFQDYDDTEICYRMKAKDSFDTTMFNHLAFDPSAGSGSFSEFMARISRSFWFRYGYSINRQAGLVIQHDAGYDEDLDFVKLVTPKVEVESLYSDDAKFDPSDIVKEKFEIYDTESDSEFAPEIDKMLFDISEDRVREQLIEPYYQITYRTSVGNTQTNSKVTDAFNADSYSAPEILFDDTLQTIQKAEFSPAPPYSSATDVDATIPARVDNQEWRVEIRLKGNANSIGLVSGEFRLRVRGITPLTDFFYNPTDGIGGWDTPVYTIEIPYSGSGDFDLEFAVNARVIPPSVTTLRIEILTPNETSGTVTWAWTEINANFYSFAVGDVTKKKLIRISDNNTLQSISGFEDERLTGDFGLSEINARLHMLAREDVQINLQGKYKQILDPMLPHIHEDKGYLITNGEYDLKQEATLIRESASIYDIVT